MASTTTSWSSLFHGLPNRTPASNLYTEEAIQNEQLTADEVIEKAQSNAHLLIEMVSAISTDTNETLQSFNKNDIIQTLYKQCQEMSDYLSERIWYDSGENSSTYYQGYNTSSSTVPQKTSEEEQQIAAFISCNEQIQTAFRHFEVVKDHLQAKQMQEEEIARSRDYDMTRPSESSFDDVDDHIGGGGSASTVVAQMFGSSRDMDYDDDESEFAHGISIAGHDARQIHLRKSEQPLIWQLDPREDFKANKNKNKKWIDRTEKERLDRERMLERSPRNGVHGLAPEPEPLETVPEPVEVASKEGETVPAVTSENVTQTIAETIVKDEAEGSKTDQTIEGNTILASNKEEEDDYGIEKIQNHIVVAEEDESDEEEEEEVINNEVEEDEGVLSDDSWEEIPDQGVVSLAICDDQDVTTTPSSSSSSPFLLTPAAGGSSPRASTPTIPFPKSIMREI
ncbi:hypothetical protein FBU30_005384 [Linnemannia zychae]|nr:hypothetical protein FBU30_005384 [Linnemannia zychae]